MILASGTFQVLTSKNISVAVIVKVYGKSEDDCREMIAEYIAHFYDNDVKLLEFRIIREDTIQ